MDRVAACADRVAEGLTLYLHGRWGGCWESRRIPVSSLLEAERELAHWVRETDYTSAVLMDHGERIAEWSL